MDFLLNHAYSFWFGFAAFIIFVFGLSKLGIKPIIAAIDAREAKLARELKESEEAYAKAKTLKEQLDAQLRSAESKIAEMMAEGRRDAEAQKAALVEQGRAEIDATRVRALREIDAAHHAALVAVRNQVAEVAALVAEKAIGERLDLAKHQELITSSLARFDAKQARN
jgi:F-type H+-transporting ATPase subunit b